MVVGFFLRFIFNFVLAYMCSTHGEQQRALELLELELQGHESPPLGTGN